MAVGPWTDFPCKDGHSARGLGALPAPGGARPRLSAGSQAGARESARALRPPREPVGSALSFPLEMESLLTSGGIRNSSREKCIAA